MLTELLYQAAERLFSSDILTVTSQFRTFLNAHRDVHFEHHCTAIFAIFSILAILAILAIVAILAIFAIFATFLILALAHSQ